MLTVDMNDDEGEKGLIAIVTTEVKGKKGKEEYDQQKEEMKEEESESKSFRGCT